MRFIRLVGCAAAVLLLVGPGASADDDTSPSASHERRVRAAIEKAMPSVVAVETGVAQPKRGHFESFASGVVISADGLVLSQHHV
ncbi:MAG: hypothetical protein ACRDD1_06075, partial [Planctomycetia bacterium]